MNQHRVTRPRFLVRYAVPSALLGVGGVRRLFPATAAASTSRMTTRGPQPTAITLNVNGTDRTITVEPRTTLLDAIRDDLHLTGSKKGCDQGTCGACTMLVDDLRVNACLMLAIATQHRRIVTIEGLAIGPALHPMQTAFIEHDGFQCGYCTPGQIMSAVGLVTEGRATDDASVREWMAGNICRCGAYAGIRAAIQAVKAPA